jgi:hypothetical protein
MPMTKPTSEQVTFLAAGAGASQRTVLDKLRDVVSVKDFGAVGDGVTDDTAAFNAAWTASNPNPVFVPAGSYAVTGAISGQFFSFGNATPVGGTIPGLQQSLFTNANALMNGDFMVAQRGTSITAATTPYANNDDAYVLDRWYILSDGNDAIDVTQNTADAPFAGGYCIALDVETVNKKFGIAQIIEKQNLNGLLGQTVTLSFKAKVSSTTKLDNVKCAIVAWSGTADTVTSDIVSAWGAEGTNPTLIANATYENVPANLGVTTSWRTFTVTAAVDTASANNVIVFIWSDVTDTTLGDFLYVTDVKLEAGSVATPYQREPFSTALLRCQRYFIGAVDTSGLAWHDLGYVYASSVGAGGSFIQRILFRVPMRSSPTVTIYGTFVTSNSNQPTAYPTTNQLMFDCTAIVAGSAISRAASNTGWYASIEM